MNNHRRKQIDLVMYQLEQLISVGKLKYFWRIMSLDVYLISKEVSVKEDRSGIFIRENGQTKQITQEEWNKRYPGMTPVKFCADSSETNEVYWANVTHNLNSMAAAVGIYEHLWRPDEIGVTKANELIDPLAEGLRKLKSDPDFYKTLNPKNGWGDYEGLVSFVSEYLEACREYPATDIEVSR